MFAGSHNGAKLGIQPIKQFVPNPALHQNSKVDEPHQNITPRNHHTIACRSEAEVVHIILSDWHFAVNVLLVCATSQTRHRKLKKKKTQNIHSNCIKFWFRADRQGGEFSFIALAHTKYKSLPRKTSPKLIPRSSAAPPSQ